MDFNFTPEEEAFRAEVRQFLDENLPPEGERDFAFAAAWQQKVREKGWVGFSWPKEVGGGGGSIAEQVILKEEMAKRKAPPLGNCFMGLAWVGPALIEYGSEEQKKRFIPEILDGTCQWCTGYSEPDSGSDLASLKTRAVEDGDHYVIDGQKTWTSGGSHMNWIYLVARTDPDAPKHRGISEFFFETSLPGVNIVPIADITGGEHFNEVFFENVRIPKTCLIGEKNKGFYQILNQLDYERSGMERLMANYPLFESLIKYTKETKRRGKPLSEDQLIRAKLAQLEIEFEIGRLHMYRVAVVMDEGRAPN